MTAPQLEVSDLRVRFGEVEALRGVSFKLDRGESLAIVGESGAGKSSLAHCIVGLISPPQATGSVLLDGAQVVGADDKLLRALRWEKVAIGLQGTPFNPVRTVGSQVAEPLRDRGGMSRAQAAHRARELAGEVELDPALLERFPHQLSGGERRLATLAMILALDPELVILDEPVAGLDPVTRGRLIERVGTLARDRGFTLIVISHDLPAAAMCAERIIVLYAGEAMEAGASRTVIDQPAHPYTWALVGAYPVMGTTKDLHPIRGRSADPRSVPDGCPFHPRCTQAEAVCATEHPALQSSRGRLVACLFGGVKEALRAEGLCKAYRSETGTVEALYEVSLRVMHGEAVGVIGRSGSGKSTLARILAGHLAPDRGSVLLGQRELSSSWGAKSRALRREVQLVMQDPWDALSPRFTARQLVSEPLELHPREGAEPSGAVEQMLEAVGLPTSDGFLASHVHELSGGELQRIALARALIAGPRLLIADEPTSMLDASEQARLLVTVRDLQVELGLGLVLISHDLAAVRKVTDRIVVLEAGRVVEEGRTDVISSVPQSAAARELVDNAPTFDVERRGSQAEAESGGRPAAWTG
ncbi:MAG: ABC transporter ATP-binding protein [Actinomycetota bacterium]|nr:ABC transporter ATP-binding protein [Actinomycetota bacterium]